MLDDFVDLWSARERGRDALVPASFAHGESRRLLRRASAARVLCLVAVVELAVLLFVASWLPGTLVVAAWVVIAVTVTAALALAAWSLPALARLERQGSRTGAARDDAQP